jgi:hypothetical protein
MSTPKSPTGITVAIVGAGFGGLTAAIECHRQGHSVTIYESFPELKTLGDIISFGGNGGRIFARWNEGKIAEKLRSLSIDLSEYGFRIHKYDTGEVVFHQKTPPQNPEAPVFNGHRGELHEVVFHYARDELGIPIRLGEFVEEYWEDEKAAGIVLKSGERVSLFFYHHLSMLIRIVLFRSPPTSSSAPTASAPRRASSSSATSTSPSPPATPSGAPGFPTRTCSRIRARASSAPTATPSTAGSGPTCIFSSAPSRTAATAAGC